MKYVETKMTLSTTTFDTFLIIYLYSTSQAIHGEW